MARPLPKGTAKKLKQGKYARRTDEKNPWTRVFNALNDLGARMQRTEAMVGVLGKIIENQGSAYPNNPAIATLEDLAKQGKLDNIDVRTKDGRDTLANLLVDGLCNRAEMTGMGAAVVRRIHTFLKGRLRDDVIGG